MESPRPARWRRRDARRRSSIRRLLLAGGATGLAAGLVAQRAVEGHAGAGTEYEWLIRGALVLPAVIFFLWWLLFPGISLEEPAEDDAPMIDATERLERIEATFDSAAVPHARHHRFDGVDGEARTAYRRSIRRRSGAQADPASFGIRRPEATSRDTGA